MSDSVNLVDAGEVRYLWHCDYWDGPLSGVAVFEGNRCWFLIEKETFTDEGSGPRHFLVVELSEKDLAYEERQHEDFRKYVGHHTDYGEDGKRPVVENCDLKPVVEMKKFYSKYESVPKKDYSQNKPLCRYIR